MLPFIEMGDLEKLEILSEEKAQKREGGKKPRHFSFNICLSFIGGKSSGGGTHDILWSELGYNKWLGSAVLNSNEDYLTCT